MLTILKSTDVYPVQKWFSFFNLDRKTGTVMNTKITIFGLSTNYLYKEPLLTSILEGGYTSCHINDGSNNDKTCGSISRPLLASFIEEDYNPMDELNTYSYFKILCYTCVTVTVISTAFCFHLLVRHIHIFGSNKQSNVPVRAPLFPLIVIVCSLIGHVMRVLYFMDPMGVRNNMFEQILRFTI
jgi:hypothetical protein